MKNLFFIALIIPMVTIAQENVSNFQLSKRVRLFNVAAGEPDKTGDFEFYIDVNTYDGVDRVGNLILSVKDLAAFKSVLNTLKETFSRYIKTAKENNVKELNKEIPIKPFKFAASFKVGSTWHFDFTVKSTADFLITKDGSYILTFQSDRLESSDNKGVYSGGIGISFYEESDFDSVINALSIQKVKDYYGDKAKKTKLFN